MLKRWKLKLFVHLLIQIIFNNLLLSQTYYEKSYKLGTSASCVVSDLQYHFISGGLDTGHIIKTNLNGDVIFSKSYHKNSSFFKIEDMILINGFIYSIGFTSANNSPTNNFTDLFIMKIDTSNGNVISSIVSGGSLDDSFTKVKATADGNLLMIGYVNSENTSFGIREGIVAKLDFNLNVLFCKKFNLNNIIHPLDFIEFNNHYFVTGGCNTSGIDQEDMMLFKLDSLGNLNWFRKYNANYSEVSTSMIIWNSNFYIGGNMSDWQGGTFFADAWACIIDSVGLVSSFKRFDFIQPGGFTQINVLDSQIILSSLGNILKLDTSLNILESKYLNLPIVDIEVRNTDVNAVISGDMNILATDTSLSSCSVNNSFLNSIDQTIIDSIINVNVSDDTLINTGGILSFNSNYIDSTICFIYTSISEYAQNSNLTVYPNPASNSININYFGMKSIDAIQLYDNVGVSKVILKVKNEYNSNQEISINTENLNSGIYYLRIHVNDSYITKKIVIFNQ